MKKIKSLDFLNADKLIIFSLLIIFGVLSAISNNMWLAIAQIMITVAVIVWAFLTHRYQRAEINSILKSVAFSADSETLDTVIKFPLPALVIRLNGDIIWHNKEFEKLLPGEIIIGKSIHNFLTDISMRKLIEEDYDPHIMTSCKNKVYQFCYNIITDNNKAKKAVAIYLVDRTHETEVEHRLDAKEAVAAIINIDNYEEIAKNVTEENKYLAFAAIDRKSNVWISSIEGISTKYEKDKLFLVFEKRNLSELTENKFDIIKQFSHLDLGGKVHATLSIGIGYGGVDIAENYQFANLALEMALGRGGDQAVVKNSEKFTFYGGNSQEVEKRNKVKPRVVAHALLKLLDQTEEVFIMGHINPDADAIGSAIGLCGTINDLGYKARIVINKQKALSPSLISDYEKVAPGVFISPTEAINQCKETSLVIIADTHKPSYVECSQILSVSKQIVIIDHHRKAAEFIENVTLSYMEPYASSACEMVTEILQYMNNKPNLPIEMAQALYAGITLDTKNFTIKTGVRTFEAASFLRRNGVDTIAVRRLFQTNLETVLKRTEIIKEAYIYSQDIAISVYTNTDNSSPNVVTSQAADELLNILGVNASFVVCLHGDNIIISGRSLGNVNVQKILEELGGGGHLTVSGAQLKGVSLAEAIAQLHDAIDKSRE
ncbi:MAG: DHH family phosphoesterase [Eubacteriales bacterium]|nr:DHH family phosphoesterase [Eubacteriales bacterium]